MRSRLASVAVLCVMLAGCVKPGEMETFVKASSVHDGCYAFELDFLDTLSTYDISFYARTEGIGRKMRQLTPVPLKVDWKNPAGEVCLSETVFLEQGGHNGVRTLYRTGVEPSLSGIWTLEVRPQGKMNPGFSGLGTICKRNDGTR